MRSPPPPYIKSLLHLAQIFGATPINLFQNHAIKSPYRKFWIRIANVLHMGWSAAVLATVVVGMLQLYRLMFFNWRTMELCLILCEQVCNVINCAIAIVGGHLQRHKFALFWQQMQELDAKLVAAYRIPDEAQRKMDLRLSVFLRFQFAIQVLLIANTTVVIVLFTKFDAAKSLAGCMALVLPNIVLLLTMTQYNGLLFFVRERIDMIVADLAQARLQLRRASKRLPTITIDASSYARLTAAVHERIGFAQRIYREVCQFEAATHRAFGVLMVSTMLSSFIIVTIELYQFYILVNERFAILSLVHAIDWTLLHFGKLFLVLYLCTKLGNAKSNLARALHQIRFRNQMEVHDEVMTSITHFSLQMLQENRFPTACGILKLELTLIGSIVSYLTTYMVILIQFNANRWKPTENCTNIKM